MYKLTLRPPGLVSIVMVLGLLFGCMSWFPNALYSVPGWAVFVAVIVPSFITAFGFYHKGSISQKIKMAALCMGIGFAYGYLANTHFQSTRILPSYEVLINAYLLGFMALGGAVTAVILFPLSMTDGVAPRKSKDSSKDASAVDAAVKSEEPASTKTSSTKIPAQPEPLKPAANISSTSLKGILDDLAPEADNEASEKPVKSGLAASLGGKTAKGTDPAAKTAPTPSSTAASTTSAAPVVEQGQGAATQTSQAPTDSQINLAAQKKATTGTGASSTATRLQAQKRKSTSTFTKLQALSASGTGGVREKPRESSGGDNDADSLKSILDRLDTKQEDYSAPEEVEMDSLFGQESLLSPPEVADAAAIETQPTKTVAPEPPKLSEPVKTPEPVKAEPLKAAEPVKAVEVVKSPEPVKAVEPIKPAEAAKSATNLPTVAKPAAASPTAKTSSPKPYDSPLAKKPADAPSLSSMLDSLDSAPKSSLASSANATSAGTAGGVTTPKAPASATPTSTPKPSTTPATETSKTEPTKPAAATASQPLKPASSSTQTNVPTATPKPAEASKAADTAKPVEATKAADVPAKTDAKEAAAPLKSEAMKADMESGLFETGLDKEIDDIFSNLVPAEAQKTVQPIESKAEPIDEHLPFSNEEVEETAAEVVESSAKIDELPSEKEGIFETQIDQELDDIFSNLVPAEAQKEVTSAKTDAKPAATKPTEIPAVEKVESKPAPEPKVVPEAAKADNGVLEESGLDRELDDIFSNLAPSEAQRSVTHETLARVRAADVTGDHPALTPENMMRNRSQEEMSFAPPSDDELEANDLHQHESSTESADAHDEILKPGKFSETLQAMPSLQATVEGLLSNLASSETKKVETESFAPPEAKESSNGGGVATQVMDLLDSLESVQPAEQEEATIPYTSHAAQESVEAAESSSGDLVNDLFKESAKVEPTAELLTESSADELAEPVGEVKAAPIVETAEVKSEAVADTSEAATAVEATTPDNQVNAVAEPVAEVEAAPASDLESAASSETDVSKKTAKQLKEFGRLSSKKGTGEFATETAGTMKTIGKLLLEVQAVENIIKAGESGTIGSGLTTARVISAARGEGIKALLSKIDSYSGVDGSVIVGHDGLVIASTAGPGMDKDTLGVLSVACLSTSNLATKKLEIGKLRQMVLVTDAKTTVLTDVDVGILAVFLNNNDVGKIDGLLEAIHDTIHG